MSQKLAQYKAVNERVLVKPIVVEEKSKAGIILVDKPTKSKLAKGKVVISGDPLVNPGDVVYYKPGSGYDVSIEAESYLIVKAKELELAFTPENV